MHQDQELATGLRMAIRLLMRRLNAEKSMPLAQLDTLALIDRSGPLTGAEIARHERVSPPAITSLLRPLFEAGYIESSESTSDRRRREVSITEHGRAALQLELESAQTWLEQAIAVGLTDDERATLAAAIPVIDRLRDL